MMATLCHSKGANLRGSLRHNCSRIDNNSHIIFGIYGPPLLRSRVRSFSTAVRGDRRPVPTSLVDGCAHSLAPHLPNLGIDALCKSRWIGLAIGQWPWGQRVGFLLRNNLPVDANLPRCMALGPHPFEKESHSHRTAHRGGGRGKDPAGEDSISASATCRDVHHDRDGGSCNRFSQSPSDCFCSAD